MAFSSYNKNNINKSTTLGIPSIFFKNRGILNFNQLTATPKTNDHKNKEPFLNAKNSSIYSDKMNYRIKRTVLTDQSDNIEQQLKLYNIIENKKRRINENDEKNSMKKLCFEENESSLNQNKSFKTDSKNRQDLSVNVNFIRSIDKEFILRDEGFLQNPRLFEDSLSSKLINIETDYIIDDAKINEDKQIEIVTKPSENSISEDKIINLNLITTKKPPVVNYKTKSINQLLSRIDNHRLTFSKKTDRLSSCKIYQKRFEDIKILLSNGLCDKEYKEISNDTHLGEVVNNNPQCSVSYQTFNVEKLKENIENKSNVTSSASTCSDLINISKNSQNESFKTESKENFYSNNKIPQLNSLQSNESKLNDSPKAVDLNNLNDLSGLNKSENSGLKENNIKLEFPLKSSNNLINSSKSDFIVPKMVNLEGNTSSTSVNNFTFGNNTLSENIKICSVIETLPNNSICQSTTSELSLSSNTFTFKNSTDNVSLNQPTSSVFGNVSNAESNKIQSTNFGFSNTGSFGKTNLNISVDSPSFSQPKISFSNPTSQGMVNTQPTLGSFSSFSTDKNNSINFFNCSSSNKDNSILNSNKTHIGITPTSLNSLNSFPVEKCSSEMFSFGKSDSNSSQISLFGSNLPKTSEISSSIPTSSVNQSETAPVSNLPFGQSKFPVFEPKKLPEPVQMQPVSISNTVPQTHNPIGTSSASFSFKESNFNNNMVFGQLSNKSANNQQEFPSTFSFGKNDALDSGPTFSKLPSSQQSFRFEPQVTTSNIFSAGKTVSNNSFDKTINKLSLPTLVTSSEQLKSESVPFFNTNSSCKTDSSANIFSQMSSQPTSIFASQNAMKPNPVTPNAQEFSLFSPSNGNSSSLKNIFSQTTVPSSFSFENTKPFNQNSDFTKNINPFDFNNK